MPTMLRLGLALFLCPLSFVLSPAQAADWIHWRGPEQNGHSREKNLPGDFDLRAKQKGNVLWTQPYGGRSSPLVMGGRIYVNRGKGEGILEGEEVVCFDEKTGKKLWDYNANVYHTDIVSSRLGWTSLTADPAMGYVYWQTTGGELICLDKAGKPVWDRQLTEELGRVTGYGGRIVSPIFDSGLVILGMPNASWGDLARGQIRYVAFDGKTGEVVWWQTFGPNLYGTYYSNPVIAVINGQRLLITGAGDGGIHAMKVRTGEVVWSRPFGKGVINGSPIADGNLVYFTHGEENPEGAPIGRVLCVDGSQVDPKTKEPKVVWDSYKRSYKANRGRPLAERFGLASAALADGLLYCPSDSGELFCFRAKDGELLWKYRYATEVRGSPLIADGKLYIFDVKARMLILTLNGEKAPDPALDEFVYRFRGEGGLLNETNGTPIAVNGHIYFTTRTDLYCLGDPMAKPECGEYKPLPAETPFKENAIAGVRLFPVDVTLAPGRKQQFQVVYIDANGRKVKDNRPAPPEKWSLPLPPKTPTGAQPPALQGTVEGGTVAVSPMPSQQGYVEFDSGGMKARARIRVISAPPYSQNFDKIPEGAVPGGWVNTAGKFNVKKLPDGSIVLSKVNNNSRPPVARANAYFIPPESSNYTIQADLWGSLTRDKMPDPGLVNSRYTLLLDGKTDSDTGKRSVRIVSWEARPRINVGADFDWKPNTWYTTKFMVEQKEKTALLLAKVWERGQPEPDKWLIEFEDPMPNRNGAAALYGYVSNIAPQDDGTVLPGSEIYYDNVTVTPNKKK